MAEGLSSFRVCPTVAVRDMDQARKFYEGTLGFKKTIMDSKEGVVYECADGTAFMLYQTKEFAGTNKATYASWNVGDFDAVVDDLREKGVKFEEYDMPGMKTKNGVATWDNEGKSMKAAWFKDPDGNIFAVVNA